MASSSSSPSPSTKDILATLGELLTTLGMLARSTATLIELVEKIARAYSDREADRRPVSECLEDAIESSEDTSEFDRGPK